jgi:hypothetical protein
LNAFFIILLFAADLLYANTIRNSGNATYPIVFNEDFSDSALILKRWTPVQNYLFTDGFSGRGIKVETSSVQSKLITASISLEGL